MLISRLRQLAPFTWLSLRLSRLCGGVVLPALGAHWPGLLVVALFALTGLAVVDDYGVGLDTDTQRTLGRVNLEYILGEREVLISDRFSRWHRNYGVAYETALAAAQRGAAKIGTQDTRDLYLLRHILTHLFFIVAGFCCYLLVYRLLHSRLLAVFALLLFLLHPRIYAHSFFNSKDAPFLAMFMVALYLLHRALRRDTATAFLLCGVAIGLLTNIRVIGVMLFPAALAMRGLDLFYAGDWAERRHILLTGGVFALAAALTLYATWPYLWGDPLAHFADALQQMAAFPKIRWLLFQGESIRSDQLPWRYIPQWIAITTPPAILLLAGVGAAALVQRGLAHPGVVFRNTKLRFGFLLLACFILPIAAVVALNSVLYNGWRIMYFLYAPLCLFAVFGLHWLASRFRFPRGNSPIPGRAGVYGLAGFGLALVVIQMAQLHPHQQVYFNFLVDRKTPEQLRTHYDMDYWLLVDREGLECLLEQYPGLPLYVAVAGDEVAGYDLGHHREHTARQRRVRPLARQRRVLPSEQRERILLSAKRDGQTDFALVNYYIHSDTGKLRELAAPSHCALRIYNNTLMSVETQWTYPKLLAAWRERHRQITATAPEARADFDLYLQEGSLAYVRESCAPGDTAARFFLHIVPANRKDLPEERRQWGVDNLDFDFSRAGAHFDGKCLVAVSLPDYPIAAIRTGQSTADGRLWATEISLRRDLYRELYPSITAVQPAHSNVFDFYLKDNALSYAKEPCAPADTAARFFLHIVPANRKDLPEERRQWGVDNLDFDFSRAGARFDGKCLATVSLPDYPIAAIRTGQSTADGRLWETEISLRQDLYRELYPSITAGQPAHSNVFDFYLKDNALSYAKEPCAPTDTAARFFLHIVPANRKDLPEERQPWGVDNRDFDFSQAGAHFDGKCLATISLPDYPIAAIRTGQFTPAGPVWETEFAVAP